jgi:polyisoprenoid-binding protein YceI
MFKKELATLLLVVLAWPALGAPEKYKIDPEHTYPSLEFSHMGISVWRGKFTKSSGSVALDRAAKTGTVEVVIDAASIDFGLPAMNDMARSDNFFNAAKYPTATYKGTIQFVGDKPKTVDGQVTIMGVTRPANLSINLFNCIPHPLLKKELCGADAEGELNWSEYGMKMSQFGQGDAGRVRLRIQVEALKQD